MILLALVSACGTDQDKRALSEKSALLGQEDVQSMSPRSDGQWNVICKDGRSEVRSLADIQQNKVCEKQQAYDFAKRCKAALTNSEERRTLNEILNYLETSSCDTAFEAVQNSVDLSLPGMQLTDLSPLAAFQKLESLDLTGNEIYDLNPLSEIKSLQRLLVGRNKVTSLQPLKALENLRLLSAEENKIQDLSPLSSLPRLESLFLTGNLVSDLAPLRTLGNLRSLAVERNSLQSLEPLKGLEKLEFLNANANAVTDMTPVAFIKTLQVLSLDKNGIKNVTPLAALPALQELSLSHNEIRRIQDFVLLKNLRILNLRANRIKEWNQLPFLSSLKQLETLDLRENPLPRIANPLCPSANAQVCKWPTEWLPVFTCDSRNAQPACKPQIQSGRQVCFSSLALQSILLLTKGTCVFTTFDTRFSSPNSEPFRTSVEHALTKDTCFEMESTVEDSAYLAGLIRCEETL
jgi:internalin A